MLTVAYHCKLHWKTVNLCISAVSTFYLLSYELPSKPNQTLVNITQPYNTRESTIFYYNYVSLHQSTRIIQNEKLLNRKIQQWFYFYYYFLCVCAFVQVFHLIARERFSVSYFVIYKRVCFSAQTHICFPSARFVFFQRMAWHKMHKYTHSRYKYRSFRIYFLIILCSETCNFLCFSSRMLR